MVKILSIDKDYLGGTSLVIEWTYSQISPYLEKLKSIVGEESFTKLNGNKIRTESKYQTIVLSSFEISSSFEYMTPEEYSRKFDQISSLEIDDLQFRGISSDSHNENISYYLVLTSKKLESVRSFMKLGPKLFHINLGFYPKDVWDKKNIKTLEEVPSFLKLLSQEYYKEANFEFVKLLKNYPLDTQTEIYPVKLENNFINFRDDMGNYFTLSQVVDRLYITNIWSESEKKPFLSTTLIEKKLKNIIQK